MPKGMSPCCMKHGSHCWSRLKIYLCKDERDQINKFNLKKNPHSVQAKKYLAVIKRVLASLVLFIISKIMDSRSMQHVRLITSANMASCIFWPGFWCCAIQTLVEICFCMFLHIFSRIWCKKYQKRCGKNV